MNGRLASWCVVQSRLPRRGGVRTPPRRAATWRLGDLPTCSKSPGRQVAKSKKRRAEPGRTVAGSRAERGGEKGARGRGFFAMMNAEWGGRGLGGGVRTPPRRQRPGVAAEPLVFVGFCGHLLVVSSSCRFVVLCLASCVSPDARRRTPDENSLCVLRGRRRRGQRFPAGGEAPDLRERRRGEGAARRAASGE